MFRKGKFNIRTNNTIRFGGKSKYTTKNRIEYEFRGKIFSIKIGKTRFCCKCGSRHSCKGFLYERNLFAKGFYKNSKTFYKTYDDG